MIAKVSKGNTKIGGTPNISLPPGITCRKDALCLTDGCYAMKSFRQYPNVRKAWTHNMDMYNKEPEEYFDSIGDQVAASGARFFRWHVAGDIINQAYFDGMVDVAELECLTKFLVFTKRYDLDFSAAPENLKVVLSIWPGMKLPEETVLPWAWLEEDGRRPLHYIYITCPGNCEMCGHKCWSYLDRDIDVIFPKH